MLTNGCATLAQQQIFERVSGWLQEIFGEFAMIDPDRPTVGVSIGSAFAMTSVMPRGDNDAYVWTRAWVVRNIEPDPNLHLFLLQENLAMLLGAFAIDEDGDILLQHTLIGSTCDKDELRRSVRSVIEIADEYDDRIIARWGGKRSTDD